MKELSREYAADALKSAAAGARVASR